MLISTDEVTRIIPVLPLVTSLLLFRRGACALVKCQLPGERFLLLGLDIRVIWVNFEADAQLITA